MSAPPEQPASYEVRVRGHLAPRWAAWFDGVDLTRHDDGTTVLHAQADQSALHALLRRTGDLGLPLVSVTTPTPTKEHVVTLDTLTAPTPRRTDPMRRVAVTGGVTYLVTFAASIPQLALFADLVADPAGFLTTPGGDTAVLWGAWLEIVTAAAGVGTAVALYPMTRRVSPTAAIGFVTSRVVEAVLILVGVVSVLTVVGLHADLAGATGARAEALTTTGVALVALRQWTFLVGPGFVAGVNALFLGYALYRSRLVPRVIPAIGLVGAPLILLSATGTLFGGWEQVSLVGLIGALPVAVWEFSLGVWLIVKGFRPTPAVDPAQV